MPKNGKKKENGKSFWEKLFGPSPERHGDMFEGIEPEVDRRGNLIPPKKKKKKK